MKTIFHAKPVKIENIMGIATAMLSVKDIDMDLVKALKKNYSKEIESLDDWILIANNDLLPDIETLAEALEKLYKYPKSITLYRGFSPNGFQDTMGLEIKGFINKTFDVELGHSFEYVLRRPTSFTTEPEIAKAFGSLVVSTEVKGLVYLPITPELVYIINERRKLEEKGLLQSQQEVIVMPASSSLRIKVIVKDNISLSKAKLKSTQW